MADSDPLFINADVGAPAYTAQELRRGLAALMWPADRGTPPRFAARQGIRPGSGDVVTVSGTTWTVHDVLAVVDPRLSSQQGPYLVQHPEESGSLDPADGSNPRIDALDLQVQDDDEDASGFRRARIVYVPGTPAASPSAPAVTATSLRLATILVPAGGSPSPSVQSLARHTAALGGILTVQDSTELAAIVNTSEYVGMYAHVIEDDVLVRRGASSGNYADNWSVVAQPLDPAVAIEIDTFDDENNISSTVFTPGVVECSGTFTAPRSGRVLVLQTFYANADTSIDVQAFFGFEVREGSAGGTQIFESTNVGAAVIRFGGADNNGVNAQATNFNLISGLTPGATYFVRGLHKVTGGSDIDIQHRRIVVSPQL